MMINEEEAPRKQVNFHGNLRNSTGAHTVSQYGNSVMDMNKPSTIYTRLLKERRERL